MFVSSPYLQVPFTCLLSFHLFVLGLAGGPGRPAPTRDRFENRPAGPSPVGFRGIGGRGIGDRSGACSTLGPGMKAGSGSPINFLNLYPLGNS
ncbi:hypothetical protein H5410_020344 [Solanum commersonii]|uniref:Secreted protein n=1 Tax=Solanum commersonii TaxID=4109 RepID=A0A9J5ZAW4_SOLCO|nr:hypothetical protein H5410_020344 [Solanum commersonii]